MSDVETRLRRLERTNRALLAAVVVMGAGMFAMGAAARRDGGDVKFDSVTARRFDLVNEDGKVLGRLGLHDVPQDTVFFSLNHPNEKIAFQVSTFSRLPKVQLFPSEGNAKISLGVDRFGNGHIKSFDKDDRETTR